MRLCGVRFGAVHVPTSWAQASHLLEEPLLTRALVADDAGTPYCFELVTTNGAYVFVAVYLLLLALRSRRDD